MAERHGVQPAFVRAVNERAVYRALREHSPATGAEIARLTRLSKPTVSAVLRSLAAAGLVAESDAPTPGGPGVFFEAVGAAGLAVGVEIRRRSVCAALTDLHGHELDRVVVDGRHASADEVFDHVEDAVRRLVAASSRPLLHSVVVGTPGVIHPRTGVLTNSGVVPALDGTVPGTLLAERLGTSVTVVNDVDLAALGEQAVGCGQGVRHFAVVHIGEGLGAALVLDGRLYEGAHGGAGEIDDIPFRRIVPSVPAVSPALDGLTALVASLAASHSRSGLSTTSTPADVFAAADGGDPLAATVIERLAEWASWFIAALSAVIDPEMIVLAGPIGAQPRLAAAVLRHLDAAMPAGPAAPMIVVSSLGEGSVLAGAIAVASRNALEQRLGERHGHRARSTA